MGSDGWSDQKAIFSSHRDPDMWTAASSLARDLCRNYSYVTLTFIIISVSAVVMSMEGSHVMENHSTISVACNDQVFSVAFERVKLVMKSVVHTQLHYRCPGESVLSGFSIWPSL